MMTVEEYAEAHKLSKWQVYRMIKRGDLETTTTTKEEVKRKTVTLIKVN